MTIHPVILAGGSGTRLWPLSREHHPKPFLPLIGERSLFQEAICRLDGIEEDVAAPVIVCNEAYRFLVVDQMRQIGISPLSIIVEPAGRNTAPALTLAALRLAEVNQASSADALMLSMHADQVMADSQAFQRAVVAASALAEGGQMVTFGVVPKTPETGYGYIRKGQKVGLSHSVSAFVEKPDSDTAKAYVASGDYLWNSGIFMMRASVWLSELKRYRPDIATACEAAYSRGNVDGDFYRPAKEDFVACPSDSIDYAVMEKAAGCAVVPLDTEWSDIGAWSALWKERDQDSDGNVIQGDVYAHSTKNALLIAQHRLLATVGMEDVIVVETGDAVLVARKDRAQDVKEIVGRLEADGRIERETHRKVHRPWGAYEIVDSGEGFQVKRLTVNAGAAISLQMHKQRAEHWVVVRGTAKVTRDEEVFLLTENQSTYIPQGTTHRLENPGDTSLEVIEVESGAYLGEDDIVRFQDDYNRHNQT